MHVTPTPSFAQSDGVVGDGIVVQIEPSPDSGTRLHFTLIATQPVPLRRMLPALQSMDLEVLQRSDGHHHFGAPDRTARDTAMNPSWTGAAGAQGFAQDWSAEADDRIRETFRAIWSGRAEADRFNDLVAQCRTQLAATSRSFGTTAGIAGRCRCRTGRHRFNEVLLDNPEATTGDDGVVRGPIRLAASPRSASSTRSG